MENTFERRIESVLRVVLLLLTLLAVVATEPYLRVGYGIGAVVDIGLIVAVRRSSMSARAALQALACVGIGLVVVAMGSLVDKGATPDQASSLVFRGVAVASGGAFLAFGSRTALMVSLGVGTIGSVVMVERGVPLVGNNSAAGMLEIWLLLGVMIVIHRSLSVHAARSEESAREANQSAELAYLDELTGLPNRRQLQMYLGASLSRADDGGHPDAVLMFDLDHFKRINDSLGHDVGDEVLQRTAAIASAAIRDGDVVGRWGGEEFVALLHEDESQARAVAERCRRALEAVGGAVGVTASFGVTVLRPDDTVTTCLRRADLALYDAKQSGRNRVVVRSEPAGPRRSSGLHGQPR